MGLTISARLFALRYDRSLAAAFGLLRWRSRNLADAILAHAVANAALAFWVPSQGCRHVL